MHEAVTLPKIEKANPLTFRGVKPKQRKFIDTSRFEIKSTTIEER